jgi:hypothetical protein
MARWGYFGDGPFGGRTTAERAPIAPVADGGIGFPGVMAFPPEVLTVLVIAALGLAGFAVYLLAVNAPKGGRKLADDRQAVAILTQHDEDITKLKVAVRRLADAQRRQAASVLSAVQRIGLVRYDAFEDMGGHLSFSAALLDANGDGLVITSINGRQDTRCYAKPVESWVSKHNLSEEEEAAIRQALTTSPAVTPVQLAGQGRGRTARPSA